MKTEVNICGKRMKFSSVRNTNSKSVSKKVPLLKQNSTLSARRRKGRVVEEGEKLFRAAMKSRRWFLEMMSMISNQPDTFITLTFPSGSKACNRAKLSKEYFNCFTKKMMKHFPKCYAMWKEETRQGRGLHFHMIARVGDHDQKLSKIYKALNKLWEEMFTMRKHVQGLLPALAHHAQFLGHHAGSARPSAGRTLRSCAQGRDHLPYASAHRP